MIMPTHIVAAAGVVENEQEEILLVKVHDSGWILFVLLQMVICALQKKTQNHAGNVQYLEYVTKPEYNLKINRKI